TWGASQPASPSPSNGVGTWSSITSSGNQVFAGFDYTNGNDTDAYFHASSDGGRTWTDPVYRMDDDTTGAPVANTVISALNANTVFGAWEDARPGYGPWLIYATRGSRAETSVAPGSHAGAPTPHVTAYPNPARAGEAVSFVAAGSGAGAGTVIDIYDLGG